MKHERIETYMVLSLFLLMGIALAGAAEDVADDEIVPFQNTVGAEMRLLQLEKSIEKNILWGKEIIASLEENGSIDTSNLESIITELEGLKEEISEVNASDAEEAAKAYVDIKDDARNLTMEFRIELNSLISPGDVDGLRKQLGRFEPNMSMNYTNMIQERLHQYNSEMVQNMLRNAGVNDSELVRQVRNGNATRQGIANAINTATMNMGSMKQLQVSSTIKEANQKNKVFARAVGEGVMSNQQERQQGRMEMRMNWAFEENASDEVLARMQLRMNLSDADLDRIQNRTQRRVMLLENWTADKITHWENLSGRLQTNNMREQERVRAMLNSTNVSEPLRTNLERQLSRLENRSAQIEEMTERKVERTENRGTGSQTTGNSGNGNKGGKKNE